MPTSTSNGFRQPLGNGLLTEATDGDGYHVDSGSNFNNFNGAIGSAGSYHLGEDWNGDDAGNSDLGDAVFSISNGVVVQNGYLASLGNYLVIRHDLPGPITVGPITTTTIFSLYAHLQSLSPTTVGQVVAIGQQIGAIGFSGAAGGFAHLHFEIRLGSGFTDPDGYNPGGAPAGWTDPTNFINAHRVLDGVTRSGIWRGTEGADNWSGTDGNDTLSGMGGDDFLTGAGGNDTLNGGSGSDNLDGGFGLDTLIGSGSGDFYHIGLRRGDDTIDDQGGGGLDVIYLYGAGEVTSANQIRLQRTGVSDAIVTVYARENTSTVLARFTILDIGGSGGRVEELRVLGVNERNSPALLNIDLRALYEQGSTPPDTAETPSVWSPYGRGGGGDTYPPRLVSSTPGRGQIGVDRNIDIELIFDESVQRGSGSISVRRVSDNSVDMVLSISSSRISFSGDTVTIDLPSGMDVGIAYWVDIGETAILDLQGIPFAGIDDPGTLQFTVEPDRDTAPPMLTVTSPSVDQSGVAPDSDIALYFSEAVVAGTGAIQIIRESDDVVVQTISASDLDQVRFSGFSAIINPSASLASNTAYTFRIEANAFRDSTGNTFVDGGASRVFRFVTGAPTLSVISGDDHDNILQGWGDANEFRGGGGDDLVYAGGGDDRIIGGLGRDSYYGGPGGDVFILLVGTDSTFSDYDIVYDFISLEDKLDISNLYNADMNLAVRIIDGYSFIYIDQTGDGEWESVFASAGGTLQAADVLTGAPSGQQIGWRIYGSIGDDLLSGGQGNDFIDGGAGDDVLIVSGLASRYRLLRDGAGFILKGPDGGDRLTGVESIRFGDGRVLELTRIYEPEFDPGSWADGRIPDALLSGGTTREDQPLVFPGPDDWTASDAWVSHQRGLPSWPDRPAPLRSDLSNLADPWTGWMLTVDEQGQIAGPCGRAGWGSGGWDF